MNKIHAKNSGANLVIFLDILVKKIGFLVFAFGSLLKKRGEYVCHS